MGDDSTSIRSQLANFATELVTIEVTTMIVERSITGAKMPQTEHALMDVAVIMWDFVCEFRKSTGNDIPEFVWDRDVHAGWAAWDRCRKLARDAFDNSPRPADPAKHLDHQLKKGKLERIFAGCDQIKGILFDTSKINNAQANETASPCGEGCVISREKGTGAVRHTHNNNPVTYAPMQGKTERGRWIPVDPRQSAIIRKIWEVKLDEIAFKTVMQLDGDIVTRIHPSYLDNARLMQIHHEALQSSQTFWKDLVDVVVRLFESLPKLLKPT